MTEPPAPARLRLKLIPILVTIALGWGVPYAGAYLAYFGSRFLGTPSPRGATLPWLYAQHAGQLAVALLMIGILKRWVPGRLRAALAAPEDLHSAGAPVGRGLRRTDDPR